VATRTVLTTSGPSRLARLTGVLRRGSETPLVVQSGEREIPVVVLAVHTVLAGGPALLADGEGTPVVCEGDQVELVGGFHPEGHAFFASRVSVVEP